MKANLRKIELSEDQYLRDKGFSLVERKGNKEPLWERAGQVFRHSFALLMVARIAAKQYPRHDSLRG